METAELTKEQRIRLLDLGFTGNDISLDESLFEYGSLYSDKLEVYLVYKDSKFDFVEITREDVIEKIKNIDAGFFISMGSSSDFCLEELKHKETSLFNIIYPIEQWDRYFSEELYFAGFMYDTIDEIINAFYRNYFSDRTCNYKKQLKQSISSNIQLTIEELREFQFVFCFTKAEKLIDMMQKSNSDTDNSIDIKIVPLSENYAKRVMGENEPLTHYVTVRRIGSNRKQIVKALFIAVNAESVKLISIKFM